MVLREGVGWLGASCRWNQLAFQPAWNRPPGQGQTLLGSLGFGIVSALPTAGWGSFMEAAPSCGADTCLHPRLALGVGKNGRQYALASRGARITVISQSKHLGILPSP